MTKGDAKSLYLRWLDEATVNGQKAGEDITADLIDRFDYFLDGAVSYLAGIFKLPAVHQVVQYAVPPLAGTGFSLRQVVPPDVYALEAAGAKSYYIEVQGAAEITISSGEGMEMLQCAGPGFQVFRGNIREPGETAVFTVSGAFPFGVKNAALFGCAFQEPPVYAPWVPYEMPEDFREFDCIVQVDGREYGTVTDYRKQGDRVFCLPYERRGAFEFHYWRNPAPLGPDAPEDATIEVIDKAAALVPLKVAVDVTAGTDETTYISDYLDRILSDMIMNIMGQETGDRRRIKTIYGQV